MPMDIRKFFAVSKQPAKAKPTKSKNDEEEDTRTEAETPTPPTQKKRPSPSSSAVATVNSSAKKKQKNDDECNNKTRTENVKKAPPSQSVMILVDTDDEEENRKASPMHSSTKNTRSASSTSVRKQPSRGSRNKPEQKKPVYKDSDESDEEIDEPLVKKTRTSPRKTAPPPKNKSPNKTPSPIKKEPTPPVTKAPSTAKKVIKTQAVHKAFVLLPEQIVEQSQPPKPMIYTQCLIDAQQTPLTFCISGVLETLSRPAAQEMVQSLGGRVTTAVSSKTDYLILGTVLEDGRAVEEGKKYQSALQHNVSIVRGEAQLFGLLHRYHEQAAGRSVETKPRETAAAAANVGSLPAEKMAPSNPYANSSGTINPYAKKSANPYATSQSKPAPSLLPGVKTTATTSLPINASYLWVDQYKPHTPEEILGNQEAVRKLTQWLQRWESTFQNNPTRKKSSLTAPQGPWKAALLSGPPGIETTTATLVARAAGRDVIEFNASDVRSKKAMTEGMGDITGSRTLEFNNSNTRRCIIMDEVDGMGAGDRSGVSELIQMIQKSQHPIICICNDRQSQKLKSLIPYCMDLKYRRPTKSAIARRAIQVAHQEGLSVEQNAAEALAESCGNDVRQVLNCLQMWSTQRDARKKTSSLSFKDWKERERAIEKDDILRVSLFDAVKVLLSGRAGLRSISESVLPDSAALERASFFRRHDAFFVDYNFTGLLVQENYLKLLTPAFNSAKRNSNTSSGGTTTATAENVLEQLELASASLSDYAVAEHHLRGGQNWGLLPLCASLMVKTGYHSAGPSGSSFPGFPEFTSWLGKNSSKNKQLRLLSELEHHLNYKVSGSKREVRMHYLPLLSSRLMDLLTDAGNDAAPAIVFMDEYGLDRDDVFEKLDEFRFKASKSKKFGELSSAQKAAFARAYNAGPHTSQALVAEQGGTKTRKKRGDGSSMETKDPDAIDEDGGGPEEEEEEEDLNEEKIKAMFKKKGRRAAGGKASKAGPAKKAPSTSKGGRKKK